MEALKRFRNVSGNILPVALNVADNTLKNRGIFNDVLDNNKKKKKGEKRNANMLLTLQCDDWRCVIFPRFSHAVAHPGHLPRFIGDR